MATDTFYPPSDATDASVYASDNVAWATARNATTGTVRAGNYIQATLSGATRFIERTFLTFDTASLPDGATISSAKLYVWIVSVSNADSPSYRLYDSAHPDTVDAGSYNDMGTTEQSSTYLISPSTGAYTSFTLNASGISAINKTGKTKYCIREATYDLGNSQPAGSNLLQIEDSSYAGTGHDPYLEVTYTAVQNLTLTWGVGAYTYTGVDWGLGRVLTMIFGTGSYIYSGIDWALRKTGWTHKTKATTSWTEKTKNTSSWTEKTKSTSSWTEKSRS